jgi:hypothetical protein
MPTSTGRVGGGRTARGPAGPYYAGMRRVSIAVIIVAVLSVAASGWLVWQYDEAAATREADPAETSTTAVGSETSDSLVMIPTVLGKNAFEAGVVLKLFGLGVTLVRTPSVTIPNNHVISQNPEQGTEVPEGTVIELTLSSGPP